MSLRRITNRIGSLVFYLGSILALASFAYVLLPTASANNADIGVLTAKVTRGPLRIEVTEKGNLESCQSVDGICELKGDQNKIIFLVPEGKQVKKNEVVCKFDTKEIDKSISEQSVKVQSAKSKVETTKQEIEVQKNKGESEISEAEVENRLAKLDLKKYVEGDYIVEVSELKGMIAQMKKEMEDTRNKLEQMQELIKKGFRSPEQMRSIEQQYEQFKYLLSKEEKKLEVKERFEKERKVTECELKVSQSAAKHLRAKANHLANLAKAKNEFDTAVATLLLETNTLQRHQEERGKCEMLAKQDGVLQYANMEYWDSSRRIREGATVYSMQKIFTLPDLSEMQIKVNIHESLIKKVKEKQKADIRVDAAPGIKLTGTVTSVAQMADSNRSWLSGGVKEYPVIVKLDQTKVEELRPGMTAELRILAGEWDDILQVPIQAVTEDQGNHLAYAKRHGSFVATPVTIGRSNLTVVEILSGLVEHEEVALDARNRLTRDPARKHSTSAQPTGKKVEASTSDVPR